jgi:antitoxin MazE6
MEFAGTQGFSVRPVPGYTRGMKTAISIPDAIFEEAERLARRTKRSRSEIYSRALADYIARHSDDRVTEAMDRTLAALEGDAGKRGADGFVAAASRKILQRTEW